jgi:DNA-binding transcriptional LysR family regulator
VPAGHQPTPAGWLRHPAKAPVRGRVPRVFDASQRDAPRTQEEYLAADHVTVVYEPRRALDLDQYLLAQGILRRFTVMVPGFAGLPPFLRGSQLLATAPQRLRSQLMQGLANAPVPVPCPTMPMYMIWHMRHQLNASHRWLRTELEAVSYSILL